MLFLNIFELLTIRPAATTAHKLYGGRKGKIIMAAITASRSQDFLCLCFKAFFFFSFSIASGITKLLCNTNHC